MRQRTFSGNVDGVRLLSLSEAQMYCGLGRNNTRKWCEEIGAVRRIGSRVLYDRNTIDAAINSTAVADANA